MTDYGSGWANTTVGELLNIRYGKALPTEERNPTGPVPVVGSAGRMTGTHTALVTSPSVLIGRKGSAGAVRLESDGCWPIDTTYYAEIPDTCHPRFLRWQLHALDLGRLDSSTTTPSLRREDLEAQPMVVPPFDEQRRIVDFLEDHLSRLDAADAYLEAAHRRSTVLPHQLLASELATVASEDVPLAELLATGLANGRSVPTQEGGFPVLRLTALRDGRIDLAERKPGAWTAADAERFLVERGDFLIARGNGSLRLVGRGGLVADEPDAVAFPDTLIRARPDLSRIHPEYMAYVWNAPGVRRQIEKSARTTAGIYKVNQKDLAAVRVPVPSLDDQQRITAVVRGSRDALSQLSVEVDRAITRSSALRRSVLGAAFSGRLTCSQSELSEVEVTIGA
jgi:type I restriction enzyme S subunit